MTSRLTLAALLFLVAASLVNGDARANHLGNAHQIEPQTFVVDANMCSGPSSGMVTGNEDATSMPLGCSGENLTVSAGAGLTRSFLVPFGNRLSSTHSYQLAQMSYHSGYSVMGAAGIPDSTVVGGVKARLNIACDLTPDYLVDSTSTLPMTDLYSTGVVAEPLVELTLGSTFPGAIPPWSTFVRYQATVDFLAVDGAAGISLPAPVTYQVITQSPPWSSNAFAVTHLIMPASGPPDAEESGCLDTAATFEDNVSGSYVFNSAAAGLYANWTTQLSAPGLQDEQVQTFTLTTSCKHIGGPVADADNDCWADVSDTDDADRDQDDDGLLDGVEVAWVNSSCVTDDDCDNDGRTDAEEMVGPAPFLTNPVMADSDTDGFLDAGYNLDCDSDGTPDMPLEDKNLGAGTGRNRISLGIVYCKPDGTSTNASSCSHPFVTVGCGGRPFGNVGAASADNCPTASNVGQTNRATNLIDLDALPVPGDTNGRFAATADNTHPDGKFDGDLCGLDVDNDGITNATEFSPMWWDATGGASTEQFCNSAGLGVAIDLDEQNPDSDGDGTQDGIECRLQTNPDDAGSKPTILAGPEQTFFRLTNLALPDGTLLATLDDDDNLTGIAEVRGGLAASQRDTDRDGCADVVELADVDGNRSANDADRLAIARARYLVAPFTGALTAEEIRTADMDHNGVVQDPDVLLANRVVLSDLLSNVLDTQPNCTAARIGYDAN